MEGPVVPQIRIERPLYEHDQLRNDLNYVKPKTSCKYLIDVKLNEFGYSDLSKSSNSRVTKNYLVENEDCLKNLRIGFAYTDFLMKTKTIRKLAVIISIEVFVSQFLHSNTRNILFSTLFS